LTRLLAMSAVALCLTFVASASATTSTGQVKHWGSYGNANTTPLPTAVENLENVVSIDAGNTSGYALESNGTVWTWGENGDGELGDGQTSPSRKQAVQAIFPAGVKIVSIGEAQDNGFAIDSTGQGWAWGMNGPGQLCLGPNAEKRVSTPTKIPGMTDALAVQGGEHHVIWLLKNGTLESCGTNSNGQLGVGTKVRKSKVPIAIPGLSKVVEISAGEKSSCARTSSGAVYDWGSNLNGQVGEGIESAAVFTPYLVPLPGAASQIACGGNLPENGSALALVGGVPYGWGADHFGQVGDGQTTNKLRPVPATAIESLGLTHLVASGAYSLGINAAGNLYAWGADEGESLGSGLGQTSLTPVLIESNVVEISATARNSVDR
jgi:alpha-tubulin suppressor-like RCC1 family protein